MTVNVSVGAAPSNLAVDAPLVVGASYRVEVVRGSGHVRYWFGPAAPTDLSYFHSLAPGATLPLPGYRGVPLWVWRADGDRAARLVVTETVESSVSFDPSP